MISKKSVGNVSTLAMNSDSTRIERERERERERQRERERARRKGVLSATHDASQVRPPIPTPAAVTLS